MNVRGENFIMKVGIDLGGSHIAIGVVDENGRIIEKQERRILDKEKQEIKTFIEEYIIKNIKEMSKKYKITNIGIAIPGTVNKTSVIKSVNLNLENYNIVEALKKKINIPIKIKNDAKCAALAENKYGSLKDYKRSIFIGLGTGIGGAVIVDDKLLDTGDLPGCEIGHMIIQKDGLECKCGKKGCFEKYASMKAFKTNLRKELNLDEKTRGEELLNILRNNNGNNKNYKKIEKVINDYIEYLSIGISNLINIFEPEAIVIGGSFVYFEDVLLNRLYKKIIEGNLLFNKRDSLIIKLAVLGNDAGIIGASLL
jgi:transcriptional repressor